MPTESESRARTTAMEDREAAREARPEAVKNAEAWRAYGAEVVPAAFDCGYLANEEELEMLQDAEIRVMAERSKAGYETTWNAAM